MLPEVMERGVRLVTPQTLVELAAPGLVEENKHPLLVAETEVEAGSEVELVAQEETLPELQPVVHLLEARWQAVTVEPVSAVQDLQAVSVAEFLITSQTLSVFRFPFVSNTITENHKDAGVTQKGPVHYQAFPFMNL